MGWKTSKFRSSLMGLMGLRPDLSDDSTVEHRLDHIRQTMLDGLGHLTPSQDLQRVRGRVLYASDAIVLWYLRGDLMTLLSGTHGETAARVQLDEITSLFQGLLPREMTPRPGPVH
jgi:hypothetical protein